MPLNVDVKPDEFQWMSSCLLICFDNAMETYDCKVIIGLQNLNQVNILEKSTIMIAYISLLKWDHYTQIS